MSLQLKVSRVALALKIPFKSPKVAKNIAPPLRGRSPLQEPMPELVLPSRTYLRDACSRLRTRSHLETPKDREILSYR